MKSMLVTVFVILSLSYASAEDEDSLCTNYSERTLTLRDRVDKFKEDQKIIEAYTEKDMEKNLDIYCHVTAEEIDILKELLFQVKNCKDAPGHNAPSVQRYRAEIVQMKEKFSAAIGCNPA